MQEVQMPELPISRISGNTLGVNALSHCASNITLKELREVEVVLQ
jgi:hypothetical protein